MQTLEPKSYSCIGQATCVRNSTCPNAIGTTDYKILSSLTIYCSLDDLNSRSSHGYSSSPVSGGVNSGSGYHSNRNRYDDYGGGSGGGRGDRRPGYRSNNSYAMQSDR